MLSDGDSPIKQALRFGVTAPSAHNTQPWRISIVSGTAARIFFDPARLLPRTDPPGRQVHISHGTLNEVTRIAATSLGYRADIGLLPDGDMTIPQFGTKPTAIIRLIADPATKVDPLFDRMLHRRSSRLRHEGQPPTPAEREQIAAAAGTPGVAVGWVAEDQLPIVREIVSKAMAVEVNDRELFEETNQWFRFSDDEIRSKGDGLNLETSGLDGLSLRLGRVFTTRKSFHRSYNRVPFLKAFDAAINSTKAMLTLTTETNTMFDWITTGRAYVRAQLAADELGFRFQPTSQALQEFAQMDALRSQLEQVLGTAAPRKVQMLVRVGRTKQPALSPRRSLDAITRPW